ncbi:MarR family winged helix-turn-helix transcriptional regulator [Patulibacter americanus]|uniref:MarR family winged helix-turn-helix transcriptional regulator n=1 Tax=Patulibacter americanus TaxID=588672 RepID=UPI0003B51B97|nr:MarR family winged helix-turn-helix transcriptional regulator [Patulibacter americanus]
MTAPPPAPDPDTRAAEDDVSGLLDVVRLQIVLWNRVDRRLRDELGLTLGQFETLWFAARAPEEAGARTVDLAHALRITAGGVSKLVDRVVGLGLAEREPDATDRRVTRVRLTAAGRDRTRRGVDVCAAELRETFPADRAADLAALGRLATGLLAAERQGGAA